VIEADLLSGIRAAAEHRAGIRCLALFRIASSRFSALRAEVEQLCRDERPSQASEPEHITHWTRPFGDVFQFSLLNRSGRFDDFSSDHDQSCIGKTFHAAAAYPAIAAFIASFPHAVNFRINVLGPHAGLSPHEERVTIRTRTGTVGARIRFHLPIVTTAGAELMLEGDVYHLAAQTLYFINHGCVHAAANRSDTARIHLTWDMLLTRQVFDAMFGTVGLPADSFVPIAGGHEVPSPIRIEHVATYERLAPNVTPTEATALALCEPQ
jgi:Aspartyl/Asparaginyl beta-hydroxylase